MSNILESTRVIVGRRSRIGAKLKAYKTVIIGSDCNIGNNGEFEESTIGDMVTLGESAMVYHATIGNNVIAGKYFMPRTRSNVGSGVRLGDRVILGAGSTIQANIVVGNNVCIGDNNRVRKNLPDNCIYNRDGVIRPRTPGKLVTRENGDCEEIDP